MCLDLHLNQWWGWRRGTGLSPPVFFFTGCFNAVLLLWIICVFVSCVSHDFASVHCCLVVTRWERADLLALVGDVYCIFVTFQSGILGQVWYFIISFLDLCRLSYFKRHGYWLPMSLKGT